MKGILICAFVMEVLLHSTFVAGQAAHNGTGMHPPVNSSHPHPPTNATDLPPPTTTGRVPTMNTTTALPPTFSPPGTGSPPPPFPTNTTIPGSSFCTAEQKAHLHRTMQWYSALSEWQASLHSWSVCPTRSCVAPHRRPAHIGYLGRLETWMSYFDDWLCRYETWMNAEQRFSAAGCPILVRRKYFDLLSLWKGKVMLYKNAYSLWVHAPCSGSSGSSGGTAGFGGA